MAERGALWGWDLDEFPAEPTGDDTGYEADQPADDAGHDSRNGHDPITEPIPLAHDDLAGVPEEDLADMAEPEPTDLPEAAAEPETWADARETSYARPFIERPAGTPISTLTFKPAPNPWYRTKPAAIALVALVAGALLLAILPLALRGGASGSDEPTGVAPAPSTNVAPSSAPPPSPSAAQPRPSSTPAPPPLPPPPPPPPAPAPAPVQDNGPAYTPYYPPRNSSPSQSDKPDVGVTRAPISVAPDKRGPIPNPATQNRNGDNSGW